MKSVIAAVVPLNAMSANFSLSEILQIQITALPTVALVSILVIYMTALLAIYQLHNALVRLYNVNPFRLFIKLL